MTPVASLDGAACPIPVATFTSTSAFGELQLPVADARGRPARIVGGELQGYSGAYMERRGNRLVFRVPRGDGQATTAHSNFPRSELKEARSWRMGDGCAVEAALILPRLGGAFEATFELEASDGRADDGVTGGEAADLHG